VPHALRGIANRALGKGETADIYLGSAEAGPDRGEPEGAHRQVTRDDVKALGAALDYARSLGALEFLDISGDYDLLMVAPASADLRPITMDLYRGTMSVPSSFDRMAEPFEGALFDFRRHCTESGAMRAYVAHARQALTAAKEDAVLGFRAAAEDRILNLDRVLAGRSLAGHRLDTVMGLVARLRIGLGDDLAGISEDARITALDWAEAVETSEGPREAGHRGSHEGGRRQRVYPLPESMRQRA
jgi:hypothetical protein